MYSGLAEAKLNWSGRVCDCVRKDAVARGHAPQEFNALRSLVRPFWTLQAGSWFNLTCLHASNVCSGRLQVRTSIFLH